MEAIIIIVALISLLLNIIILVKVIKPKENKENLGLSQEMKQSTRDIMDTISKGNSYLLQENFKTQKATEQELTKLLSEGQIKQQEMLHEISVTNKDSQLETQKNILKTLTDMITSNKENQMEIVKSNNENHMQMVKANKDSYAEMMKSNQAGYAEMIKTNQEGQTTLAEAVKASMNDIRKMNEEKLDHINKAVSDKLDKSLNERLDHNFKQIGERLGSLYESLGELNKLSSGVTDLNKTLSNVKTRGVWGEIQLQNILEDTMTPNLYETNVATKKNSADRVEFAIKIPSKDNDKDIVLLPIDSKFPSDIFNKIVTASEEGNAQNVVIATKELEQRIKTEARTIRDKYIDPPNTTDFAIMFLPTESLFSEVLRINGLNEWCQTNCKIVIAGPTTITALLNSLRVGFSNLTLNKKTQEVIKTLQAVKTQYSTLDDLIDKTQKKLNDAIGNTDKLKHRTQMIQNKMKNIDMIEYEESKKVLGIDSMIETEEE